jgi:hypothetical protein
MAADLRDTGITVNLLLPDGATATGMLPPGLVPEGQGFLEPAVMGPPIVWLASDRRSACTTSGSSPPNSTAGCATGRRAVRRADGLARKPGP